MISASFAIAVTPSFNSYHIVLCRYSENETLYVMLCHPQRLKLLLCFPFRYDALCGFSLLEIAAFNCDLKRLLPLL
jgi:hypothetical protein